MKKKPEHQADNQSTNSTTEVPKSKADHLAPFQWKKGQSGNIAGRPKGKTMKEYARELLERQTEEERQEFLHGLPKEIIWKMAEGNPKQDTDVTTGGDRLTPIIVKFLDGKQQPNDNRDTPGVSETV